MKVWHEGVLNYLGSKELKRLHMDCCLLRSEYGSSKNRNSKYKYVFNYDYSYLYGYHLIVMNEMKERGWNPNKEWLNPLYRGASSPLIGDEFDKYIGEALLERYLDNSIPVFTEHDNSYYEKCMEEVQYV